MLRRAMVWLLAVALVLGAAGPSAAAAKRCMAGGEEAPVAGLFLADCTSCDDRGDSSQPQSGCALAACTAGCTIGPAAPTGGTFLLMAFETAGLVAAVPGDPPGARSVPPDPPPPR